MVYPQVIICYHSSEHKLVLLRYIYIENFFHIHDDKEKDNLLTI